MLLKYAGLGPRPGAGLFLIGGETEDLIQEGMVGLYHAVGEYRPDREDGMSFKNLPTFAFRGGSSTP